jgi:hypothetical protein
MHPTITFDIWQREHEQRLLEQRRRAQQAEILEARSHLDGHAAGRPPERWAQPLVVLAPAMLAVR